MLSKYHRYKIALVQFGSTAAATVVEMNLSCRVNMEKK